MNLTPSYKEKSKAKSRFICATPQLSASHVSTLTRFYSVSTGVRFESSSHSPSHGLKSSSEYTKLCVLPSSCIPPFLSSHNEHVWMFFFSNIFNHSCFFFCQHGNVVCSVYCGFLSSYLSFCFGLWLCNWCNRVMKKTISNVCALKIPRKYFCTEGVKVAGSAIGEASNVSIQHSFVNNYIFLVVYCVCVCVRNWIHLHSVRAIRG